MTRVKREDFLFKRPVCRPCVFAGRFTKSVSIFYLNDRSADLACSPVALKKSGRHIYTRVIASGGAPRGDPEKSTRGTRVILA